MRTQCLDIDRSNEDGEPVSGRKLPVTVQHSQSSIRLVFGDTETGPDLYIEAKEDGLRIILHPEYGGDPQLNMERFDDGTLCLSNDNGFNVTLDEYGDQVSGNSTRN
jgi:hypothetical protein